MSFPLYYILFPLALFLIVWVFLSLAGVYHLLRFGFHHIGIVLVILIYIGGSVLLLQISYTYLAPTDWQTPVVVFANMPTALPSFGTSY